MFKLILGIIIGYAAVMIWGPDVAYIIYNGVIEIIREEVNSQ